MGATIYTGDAIKWAWQYEGPRFHALLCDPPYELGFMGKDWDRSGVAFDPATWRAFYAIMLPGAFGMAFASARGWHRLACAIEDAGFVIHPTIFGWAYGSGFPKATRIDTQIDKAAGAERTRFDLRPIAYPDSNCWGVPNHNSKGNDIGFTTQGTGNRKDMDGKGNQIKSLPATPLAQSWVGHRYGLQALKPALEPIIVFQRPYEGKPIDCITETGAGALWIDGGRVGHNDIEKFTIRDNTMFLGTRHNTSTIASASPTGRWPANFLLLDKKTVRVYNLIDNIPQGIKETIKEYYHDYSHVRSMWWIEEDLPIEIETGAREVLQQSLLQQMDEREHTWRFASDEGQEAYSGVAQTDELASGGKYSLLPETKDDEKRAGLVHQQGVQVYSPIGGGAGDIWVNVQDQSNVEVERDVCTRASASNSASPGATAGELGNSTSYQRRQDGQPDREPSVITDGRTHKGASEDLRRSARFTEGERRTAETACFVAEVDIPEGWRKYFTPTNLSIVYDAAAALDRQSGESESSNRPRNTKRNNWKFFAQNDEKPGVVSYGFVDSGGASRFYFRVSEQLDEADPVRYCAKASRSERDAGLEGEPMQSRDNQSHWIRKCNVCGDTFCDPITSKPHCGHNDFGFVEPSPRHNPHPTVKPIALARYLATLLLPPTEYAPRRLFVPFAGVGSEMIGAHQAGWEIIEGVELEDDSADIGRKRIDYWVSKPVQTELFIKSE